MVTLLMYEYPETENAPAILTKFNCADELWMPFQLINYFWGKSSRHLHVNDWRCYKRIIAKPTEQTVDCIDVSEEPLAPGKPEFHNVPANLRWTGSGQIFFRWYNNIRFRIKPNFYTICHNHLLVIILHILKYVLMFPTCIYFIFWNLFIAWVKFYR